MKLITLLLGCLLLISVSAQQERTVISKNVKSVNNESSVSQNPENKVTYKVNQEKLAKKNQKTELNQKTVAYYDSFIAALETKVEYVKNDPTENALAESNGWFTQIESSLKKARKEREELLSLKK